MMDRGHIDEADVGGKLAPQSGMVRLRIPRPLFELMQSDLSRPHPFAAERVGFLSVATGMANGELLVFAAEYYPIADEHYVEGRGAGARIGADAIRATMQRIYDTGRGVFHVHMHEHHGLPEFSPTDSREQPRLVASFRAVNRRVPHGMLLLSRDQAYSWVWDPRGVDPVVPHAISIVGYPTSLISPRHDRAGLGERVGASDAQSSRHIRQTFLGRHAEKIIERARVGVVGLGGGGSHVVQQLAHIGFKQFRIFDGDRVDETNLNRLVGATIADVAAKTLKTDIAQRVIRSVAPDADVRAFSDRWQSCPDALRSLDVIVGCVDSFAERRELEVACRRYLIAYVDIGMDINEVRGEAPRMGGQVILSLPDSKCFFCMGFLNDARLAQEAALYGAAGGRPQVIWPNGILASTAVGVVIDVITGWTRQRNHQIYLSYDGNANTLVPHIRLRYLDSTQCEHFPSTGVGDPRYRPLE